MLIIEGHAHDHSTNGHEKRCIRNDYKVISQKSAICYEKIVVNIKIRPFYYQRTPKRDVRVREGGYQNTHILNVQTYLLWFLKMERYNGATYQNKANS